jgi:sigma-E factor negative regulatory protein RseC
MIEETGFVVSTEGECAWVEVRRKSACGSCSVSKGCGTSVLSQVLGRRPNRVLAFNDAGAVAGDEVVLGIPDEALLRGSFAVYAVPLLALLAGALLGGLYADGSGHYNEALSVLFGLFGMAGGFLWVRRFSQRIRHDRRFQPSILRRAGVSAVPVNFLPGEDRFDQEKT